MKGDSMKIAISSMGTDLDAQLDPRFGRLQTALDLAHARPPANSTQSELHDLKNPATDFLLFTQTTN